MSSSSSPSLSSLSTKSTSSSFSSVSTSSSSLSSSSSSSSSSISSSSSSRSSESSPWDTEWFSVLHKPDPVKDRKSSKICAQLQLDLRHSDAIIVQYCGPLSINLGGTFAGETKPKCVVNLIDDYVMKDKFNTFEAANAWQDEIENRIRAKLEAFRVAFLDVHPDFFDERHRRI